MYNRDPLQTPAPIDSSAVRALPRGDYRHVHLFARRPIARRSTSAPVRRCCYRYFRKFEVLMWSACVRLVPL